MRYSEELTTVIGKLHIEADKARQRPGNFAEELAAAYESAASVLYTEFQRHLRDTPFCEHGVHLGDANPNRPCEACRKERPAPSTITFNGRTLEAEE